MLLNARLNSEKNVLVANASDGVGNKKSPPIQRMPSKVRYSDSDGNLEYHDACRNIFGKWLMSHKLLDLRVSLEDG